jgi:Fur family zinc uptake transcriptional regulator
MDDAELARLLGLAETLCRRRGQRLTAQRRRVLEILCRSERPMGAYEILDLLPGAKGRSAPPTVYRALDFLLEQGLIHRIETLHAFIGCDHPDARHSCQFLICDRCGTVAALEDSEITSSLSRAAQRQGFAPARRVVELIGTCSACAKDC